MRPSSSPASPAASPATPKNEEFLKLKYKINFKDWKIEIGTVLFSRNGEGRSTFNIPGRIIDKIREQSARDWISSYVNKNMSDLADAKTFLAHINKDGGVKKSELVHLLAEAKLKGMALAPEPVLAGRENLTLDNVDKIIVDHLNNGLDSQSFSEPSLQAYISYLKPKKHSVNEENCTELNKFVLAFKKLAAAKPDSAFVKQNAGRVKLLMHAVKRFERDARSASSSPERKKVSDFIANLVKTKKLSPDTKIMLSAFQNYLVGDASFLNPDYLSHLIQIAESKDAIALLFKLKPDEHRGTSLQRDMQAILVELNEDLSAAENLPDSKEVAGKLLRNRTSVIFDESNERVKELWTSEFPKFLIQGDMAIDENSFTKLKELSDFALSNLDLFSSSLEFFSQDELNIMHIYLKKLAADLKIFENNIEQ
jgi:hypothetical protein